MLNLIRAARLPSTTLGLFNASRAFSSSAVAFKVGKQQEDALRSMGFEPPPKAPAAGYARYAKDFFAKNKESLAGPDGKIDIQDANSQIREKWDAMSSGEKGRYESAYKRERETYEAFFRDWLQRYSGDIRKIEGVIGKLRIPGGRKGQVDPGKRGRQSGYIMFCGDLRSKGSIKIDDSATAREKISTFGKEAGRRWKALSESDRESWNNRAKAA